MNPAGPVPFRWRAVLPGELHSTPWRIVAHPSDPMLILTIANLDRLLRSKDGGESWVKLEREFGKVRGLVWQRG